MIPLFTNMKSLKNLQNRQSRPYGSIAGDGLRSLISLISLRLFKVSPCKVSSAKVSVFGLLAVVAGFSALYGADGDTDELERLSAQYDRVELIADSVSQFNANGDLESYLAFAALNNSGLKAAFYNWVAESKRAGYAGAAPDPMLNYGYFIENVETRVGPQNQRIGLRQSLPWFGSLGARKRIAMGAAGGAYHTYQSQKLQLFNRVKSAYYDLYSLGRETTLTQENIVLLTLWEAVARTKYSTGLSSYADVLKAQVELGLLEDKLLTLQSKKLPTFARLRAAVGLGAKSTVEISIPETLSPDEQTLDREVIIESALANNPDLDALGSLLAGAEAGRELAGKSSYPNLTLGVDYIETGAALNPALAESGKDPLMVSLGLSLPIWFGKNSSKKDEASAKVRRSHYALEEKRRRIVEAVEQALFRHDDALRRISLYRNGLIPKAEQALNAAFTAYEAGETEFLSLLDSQRLLLKFQLQYDLGLTRLAKATSEIELLMGVDQ